MAAVSERVVCGSNCGRCILAVHKNIILEVLERWVQVSGHSGGNIC